MHSSVIRALSVKVIYINKPVNGALRLDMQGGEK